MESKTRMRPPTGLINIKKLGRINLKEWLKNENHVYIGRNLERYVDDAKFSDNKWGNPYPVGKYTREESLVKYEKYARASLLDQLEELSGKTMACWCRPQACHGDILIKLFKEKHCPSSIRIGLGKRDENE